MIINCDGEADISSIKVQKNGSLSVKANSTKINPGFTMNLGGSLIINSK